MGFRIQGGPPAGAFPPGKKGQADSEQSTQAAPQSASIAPLAGNITASAAEALAASAQAGLAMSGNALASGLSPLVRPGDSLHPSTANGVNAFMDTMVAEFA